MSGGSRRRDDDRAADPALPQPPLNEIDPDVQKAFSTPAALLAGLTNPSKKPPWFLPDTFVDVRDVAELHVRSVYTEAASGQRIALIGGGFSWDAACTSHLAAPFDLPCLLLVADKAVGFSKGREPVDAPRDLLSGCSEEQSNAKMCSTLRRWPSPQVSRILCAVPGIVLSFTRVQD